MCWKDKREKRDRKTQDKLAATRKAKNEKERINVKSMNKKIITISRELGSG